MKTLKVNLENYDVKQLERFDDDWFNADKGMVINEIGYTDKFAYVIIPNWAKVVVFDKTSHTASFLSEAINFDVTDTSVLVHLVE